ncbi:MAG TPA: dihydrofolate reductase family protein [Gemmatimonadaceae bacterium]|nr:dihydrofolate reductase family protein [Gemmatimonadaceae bacterium]
MRKVMVLENLTLDGVMQAPGGRDEDRRGGFEHGGWSGPYNDAAKMQRMGEGMSRGADLLFGRWTYEKFHEVWHGRTDNPFTPVLDRSRKYVASRTLRDPLPWANSTLLDGDAADAVARLKQEDGLDLLVMGSGVLVESLRRRDLVDEYFLLIHPLVLGTGRRLFEEGAVPASLALVDCAPTTTGVLMATFRPASRAAASAK